MIKHALLILLFQLSWYQSKTNAQLVEDLDPVEPMEDTMFAPDTYYYINKLAEILNFIMLACGVWRMWKGRGSSVEELEKENEELRQNYEELKKELDLIKKEKEILEKMKDQNKTISQMTEMLHDKNNIAAGYSTADVGKKLADLASFWETEMKNSGDQTKCKDLSPQHSGIIPEGTDIGFTSICKNDKDELDSYKRTHNHPERTETQQSHTSSPSC